MSQIICFYSGLLCLATERSRSRRAERQTNSLLSRGMVSYIGWLFILWVLLISSFCGWTHVSNSTLG